MLKILDGLYHRAERLITGMTDTRGASGEWEYPPVVAAMDTAGLHTTREYIRRWQATIAEKVA